MDETEDAFNFKAIPEHLHKNVFEKFTFPDHAKFQQCSKFCLNLLNSNPTVVYPAEVYEISISKHDEVFPSRNKQISVKLSEIHNARLQADSFTSLAGVDNIVGRELLSTIKRHNISATELVFEHFVKCDVEILEEMIKTLRCDSLHFYDSFKGEYLDSEVVQKMNYLSIFEDNNITNDRLLKLQSPTLELLSTSLTTNGLIQFVEQWRTKQRKISWCQFGSLSPINKEDFCKAFHLAVPEKNIVAIKRDDGKRLSITFNWIEGRVRLMVMPPIRKE